MQTELKKRIILPLIFTLLMVVAAFALSTYWLEQRRVDNEMERTRTTASQMMHEIVLADAKLLEALLQSLLQKHDFTKAIANQDSSGLMRHSDPLFSTLMHSSRVSRFTLLSDKGQVLYRAHNPAHKGDYPPWAPPLMAAVKAKTPAQGLAITSSATPALYVLLPIRQNGRIVGYLAAAEELTGVSQEISQILDDPVLLVVKKSQLNALEWERAAATKKEGARWDRLSHYVFAEPPPPFSDSFFTHLNQALAEAGPHPEEFEESGTLLHIGLFPILGMDGQPIAQGLVLADIAKHRYQVTATVFLVSFFFLLMGGGLSAVFWNYLGRVETHIGQTHNELTQTQLEKKALEQKSVLAVLEVLQKNPEAFFAVDWNWTILHTNAKAEDIFGRQQKELLGNNLWDEFPELASFFYQPIQQAKKQNGLVVEEGFYPPLSRWFSLRAFPTSLGLGIMLVDITARKQAEEALAQSHQGLEQKVAERTESLTRSEERFRNLVDWSVVGIAIVQHGLMVFTNQAMANMLGYDSPQQLKGAAPEAFATVDHRPRVEREIKKLTQKEINTAEMEIQIQRKDGSVFWGQLSCKIVTWNDHRALMWFISDITGRKQVEEELTLAKEVAETANRAKSQFLSQMSHDLRTPLNAILGFAQILETDPDHPLNPDQLESVEYIKKGGHHLLALIDEVLDLAKIETGNIPLTIEETDPAPVVFELIQLSKPVAEKRNISLDCQLDVNHCPLLKLDRTRFRQVLFNFISNAIKYNLPNGQVKIASQTGQGRFRLMVTDNGPGIPFELQGNIFQPFNRLGQEEGDIEGTGIGLTISKKLVELMGGAIGFESQPGRGTTFWMEFPIHKTAIGAGSFIDPSAAALAPAQNGHPAKNLTLLYVEDNPANLALMKKVVARMKGMTLLSAPDASHGLDLAEAHQPDLVIMDINLPGISGLEAVKMMRQNPKTAAIPAIALSANAMERDINLGLEAGFLAYLTKPVKLEPLYQAIEKAIGKK